MGDEHYRSMSEQEKTNALSELNENPLSEREMDVARLLATGASNTEIARELTISPHTVKVHLRNTFEKLGVNSRTEASMLLIQRGWLTVPGMEVAETTADDTATSDSPPELVEEKTADVADLPIVDKNKEATASSSTKQPTAPDRSTALSTPTQNKHSAKTTKEQPLAPPASKLLVKPSGVKIEPGQIFAWQRFYLLIAVALSLFIFIPTLLSQSVPGPNLLSDAGSPDHSPIIESASRWRGRTPMPEPRSRLAVAQIGELIYAIGGENSSGQTIATTEIYDLAINEWTSDASLPIPLANSVATMLNGRIYVAGGSYNTTDINELNDSAEPNSADLAISNRLFVYTPSSDRSIAGTWREAGLLPNPLAGAAMVSLDDSLYLIGGWDGSSMRDEIWRVKPSAEIAEPLPSWSLSDRMDVARAFIGAAVLHGNIYIVGGFDGNRELNFADRYRVTEKVWEQLPPLSIPRGGLQLVSNELAVFAFGGGWSKPVNTHERFDPNTQLWSNFESPVREEWRHFGAVNHDRSIYVFGGWSGGYLDTHQQYETSLSRMLLPLIQSQSTSD